MVEHTRPVNTKQVVSHDLKDLDGRHAKAEVRQMQDPIAPGKGRHHVGSVASLSAGPAGNHKQLFIA